VSAPDEDPRPRLARGTRLRWDAVREQHLLLVPEGALVLNPTAAAVLELCDGSRTLAEVVRELEVRYPGAEVADDVRELLQRLAQRALVTYDHG
jgi:pyrroloquinoline quinone biosynthesis protein D